MQEENKKNQSDNENQNFISSLFGSKIKNTINNPDELNDYIKVLRPSALFVLVAIMIFAVGISIWGIFGKITANVNAYIDIYKGTTNIYIDSFNNENVKSGMTIKFKDKKYIVDFVEEDRILVDDEFIDELYKRQINDKEIGLHRGDYITKIHSKDLKLASENIADGFYIAKIEIESISPIRYLFN